MSAIGIQIQGGITISGGGVIFEATPPTLVLSLDAAGYTTGPWIDNISSRSFTLYGGVTHSSDGGGSFVFDPTSSQYGECASSLSDLNTWTVEAWHYYAGTNSAGSPCIVTENYPGITGHINYGLGNNSDSSPNLQSGWWNGGTWQPTPQGYTLTAGNWYHFVVSHPDFSSTVNLYLNGVLKLTSTDLGNYSSSDTISTTQSISGFNPWGGKIAIIRIYKQKGLTQAEVTQNFNALRGRFAL